MEIYTKERKQKKYDDLASECGVFWAFNEDQFKEGKAKNPLKEGEKYASIGMGGYMPSKNVDKFIAGMDAIDKWAREAKKDDKKVILYELNNHECFYTGSIDDAMPTLESLGYTKNQVLKIFKAERKKQNEKSLQNKKILG
jgi:hypothetical protein